MARDLFELDGRVALVTGASRGLGAAMATALASAGADVALHASERPASATADEIRTTSGRRTVQLTANLADRAAADRLVDETLASFGRLDILVNNAGIIQRQPAVDHSDESWDHRQHDGPAGGSRPWPSDRRTHPRRAVGHATGSRGRGGLSRVARLRLRPRPRARRGRRLDEPLGQHRGHRWPTQLPTVRR
jgi:hypothetical protein